LGKAYGSGEPPKLTWMFDEDMYEQDEHYQVYQGAVEALRMAAPELEVYVPEDPDDPDDEPYTERYDDVPTFNDDDRTKYQDVIGAFDKAIATEEAKHLASALT